MTDAAAIPYVPVPRFKVGDMVDLSLWDGSTRPEQRIGQRRVVAVETCRACESGILVFIEGRPVGFDQGWLKLAPTQPFDPGL